MKKGFTLIEILVTVVIIGVLTAVAIVSYTSINRRSRDVKRKADIEQVRQALEMYRSDNGTYPVVSGFSDMSGLATFLVPDYLPTIPTDPQTTYTYQVKVNAYTYCICSHLETLTATDNTCVDSLPTDCNYGRHNP